MDLKKPLTFQQQVLRLEEHGMIVPSHEEAEEFFRYTNNIRKKIIFL